MVITYSFGWVCQSGDAHLPYPADTPTVCLTLLWRPRPQKPKAPKVLPPDAVSRHPVGLLHDMRRPSVVYEMTEHIKPAAAGQEHSYTMAVTVDGRQFKATGGCPTDK